MLDTALMLIATVLSLAYSLRFISHVFFGHPKTTTENRTFKVPKFMTAGMAILAVLTVVIGIDPAFFINLISMVHFI